MMLPGRPLLRPLSRVWIGLVVAGAVLGSACGEGAGAGPTNAAIGSTTGLATTTAVVITTETAITTPTTATATTSVPATTSTTTTSVPATTSITLPAWWRPVTPEDPLRVWVVGDSLGGPLGNALAARVRAAGLVAVTIDFEDGTGLVRDDVFDWPGYAAQRLPQVDPDVVVSLLGANDGQALWLASARLEFGSREWDREYTERVGEFMDLLIEGSARVYWVGVPSMFDADYDSRVQHINALQWGQAAARGQLGFVDGYSLFRNEAGEYAAQLLDEDGDLVTMRQPDGIHLTGAGADHLALAVLRSVASDWGPAALSGG